MTRKEMLAMVRKLIADEQSTGYTEGGNLEEPEGTQELENYLNRAVDEYSKRQATARDVRLMKTMTVSNGGKLPDDYLSFCGVVPVTVNGKIVNYYNPAIASKMPIRYFARLPYATAYGENVQLPYDEDQYIAICALAAIYALNKHEYNVSQHLMLMGYGAAGATNASQ